MPKTVLELDALALRVQGGDQDAFHDLVLELQHELRLFIAAHASSLDMVEEVVQATFVTCYEIIGRYQPQGTFLSWLKGIARNRLRRELRDRARYLASEGEVLEQLLADDSALRLEQDEEAAESNALALGRLRQCLGKLPLWAQQLLERRHGGNVPVNRLAQQFKKSRESIASTLKRVRRSLRECVEGGAA